MTLLKTKGANLCLPSQIWLAESTNKCGFCFFRNGDMSGNAISELGDVLTHSHRGEKIVVALFVTVDIASC